MHNVDYGLDHRIDPGVATDGDFNAGLVDRPKVDLNRQVRYLKSLVLVFLLLTVGLAIFREIFLQVFGDDTPLKSLRQLDMDEENSLPTWLSSLLMTACAAGAGYIAFLKHQERQRFAGAFAMLGMLFVAMSIDETASFHESLIDPLRSAFGTSGVLQFAWVIVGAPVAVIVFLVFLPMLRNLGWYGVRLVLAGAIFVSGAVGFELLGGWLDSNGLRHSGIYEIEVLLEETLEFVGLTVALFMLIDYAAMIRRNMMARISR